MSITNPFGFPAQPSHMRPTFWLAFIFVLVLVITSFNRLLAESVAVHHREGVSHGFVVLRSIDGHVLASGDMIQVADGERIKSEVIFHFKDGSLHDETTVFSQDHTFRLLSDHLIQHGPSFPKSIDILIDATKNEVTVHANEKGKEKDEMQHIDLPEDLSNGMVLTLVRNIPDEIPSTSAVRRLVSFSIWIRSQSRLTR